MPGQHSYISSNNLIVFDDPCRTESDSRQMIMYIKARNVHGSKMWQPFSGFSMTFQNLYSLTSATQVHNQFTYPQGCKGLGGWLHTETAYLSSDSHPSK